MIFSSAFLIVKATTLLILAWGTCALEYDIYLYAGSGQAGSTGSGGKATSATLNVPRAIWQDTQFSSYILEASGRCLRRVSTTNIITTVVGTGVQGSTGNGGPASSATFDTPVSLFIDSTSKLYIADYYSYNIRQVNVNAIISLYAGTGVPADSGNGGPASSAGINGPHGIWGNSVGTMYIAEYAGCTMRAVSASGTISLFAGR